MLFHHHLLIPRRIIRGMFGQGTTGADAGPGSRGRLVQSGTRALLSLEICWNDLLFHAQKYPERLPRPCFVNPTAKPSSQYIR